MNSLRPAHLRPSRRGFALVEVMTAATLLGVLVVSSIQALSALNSRAASTRLMTNSRAIVQRNLDTALSIVCTKSSIPPILALTSTTGDLYDDDGGAAGVTVALQGTGAVNFVQGELRRIVQPVTVVEGGSNVSVDYIRKITFRITYPFRGKSYAYEVSSMRAIDD